MSNFQFVDAAREQAKLRLAMMGQSGGGKTWSMLDILYGVVGDWSKVFVIDTERGSASLYAHKCGTGPRFKVLRLESPFSPDRYRQAIHAAEEAGAEAILIDSLSHAWEGEGGALDRVDAAASKTHNSFTAWKDVTPEHRAMVDAILQSPCHIGATLRSKQEYVLEKDEKGKMVPKRVGLAPIQRAGMEYEFTIFMDIDDSHKALATKDRTSLFDGARFKPEIETGKKLKKWLDEGAPTAAPAAKPTFKDAAAAMIEEAKGQAPAPGPYHPNDNDGPAPSLTDAINTMRALIERVEKVANKQEGAKLWDEIIKAKPIIGDEGVADLQKTLKQKAASLK